MIKITTGNLLKADVDALVNTVNTEGVMGKGIAAQFKLAYPEVFEQYRDACKQGNVRLGEINVADVGALGGGPRWVLNFPTKGHWRAKSRLADIEAGLQDLRRKIIDLKIRSIAVPPLGCGNGGLAWRDVLPLIESSLGDLDGVAVHVYPPTGAPAAKDMPVRTIKPKMTLAIASVVALMARYKMPLLDPKVRLLEAQKLMYFLQESGESLRLNYVKHTYGPYAANLRHVLSRAEGHWITGFGDGHDSPKKELDLLSGAAEEAEVVLTSRPETCARMTRVAELIEGFEDPFGLELLSTVHWAMCHDPVARDSAEGAMNYVWAWSDRKAASMKPEQIEAAWRQLKDLEWDAISRSAIH